MSAPQTPRQEISPLALVDPTLLVLSENLDDAVGKLKGVALIISQAQIGPAEVLRDENQDGNSANARVSFLSKHRARTKKGQGSFCRLDWSLAWFHPRSAVQGYPKNLQNGWLALEVELELVIGNWLTSDKVRRGIFQVSYTRHAGWNVPRVDRETQEAAPDLMRNFPEFLETDSARRRLPQERATELIASLAQSYAIARTTST